MVLPQTPRGSAGNSATSSGRTTAGAPASRAATVSTPELGHGKWPKDLRELSCSYVAVLCARIRRTTFANATSPR
eukprot:3000597-Pyramimonas_sp.AAC.1